MVGDGAMQMNGMAELLTIAKYWKEWSDPRLVVLVLHNNDLSQVTWEMRAMEGDPRFEASQQLPECDYAGFAEMIGLRGLRMDHPDHVGEHLGRGFRCDRPMVVDADHGSKRATAAATYDLGASDGHALGPVERRSRLGRIIRQSFKGKIKEFTAP